VKDCQLVQYATYYKLNAFNDSTTHKFQSNKVNRLTHFVVKCIDNIMLKFSYM